MIVIRDVLVIYEHDRGKKNVRKGHIFKIPGFIILLSIFLFKVTTDLPAPKARDMCPASLTFSQALGERYFSLTHVQTPVDCVKFNES